MRLTPKEYEVLESALLDAYADYEDLRRTLRRVGNRIQDISAPGPLPRVIESVIEFAETKDLVPQLIAAARVSNPTNVELFKVAAAIGLEPAGVPEGQLAPD